jgi:hypothetical protein
MLLCVGQVLQPERLQVLLGIIEPAACVKMRSETLEKMLPAPMSEAPYYLVLWNKADRQ